jgi:PRTRC genetic system protein B
MALIPVKTLDERRYDATTALILYSLRRGSDEGYLSHDEQDLQNYVTIHRIEDGSVREGKPITKKQLLRLCQSVMPKLKAKPIYLPSEVLSYNTIDGSVMVWWRPAGIQTLFFSKEMKIRSGKAPLPPLVFIFNQGSLRTVALKEDRRPDPETDVYFTPFYNDGCMGNARVPISVTTKETRNLEELFFQGAFTTHGTPTLEGTDGQSLWSGLTRSGLSEFPYDCLKKRGKLKDIIQEE